MPAACCATRRGRVSPTRWCATARPSRPRRWPRPSRRRRATSTTRTRIGTTDDRARGWLYFNLVLQHAGVAQNARHRCGAGRAARVSPARQPLGARRARRRAGAGRAERPRAEAGRGVERQRPAASTCSIASTSRSGSTTSSIRTSGASRSPIRGCSSSRSSSRAPTRRSTVHVGDLYHVDVMGARRAGLREGVLFDMAGLYDDVDCPRVDFARGAGRVDRQAEREPDAEPRALTFGRRHAQRRAVAAHDAAHRGHAESAAGVLGREERIEHPRQRVSFMPTPLSTTSMKT